MHPELTGAAAPADRQRPAPAGVLGTIIIGAGPAGLGPLVAARHDGTLDALLAHGLVVLEQGQAIGSGELGQYSIRSDSHADSFLVPLASSAPPDLAPLLAGGPGASLEAGRGAAVPLATVAHFMGQVGGTLRQWLAEHRDDPFLCGRRAIAAQRQADGHWLVTCRRSDGVTETLRSQNVVLATGAAQSLAALAHATVGGDTLLPRHADKTVLSGALLGEAGAALLAQRLAGVQAPRVVVLGGSHSAMSSALFCLQQWDAQGIAGSVSVLHRRPFRLMYTSPEAARDEGYTDFGPQDICPRSGRVYPLAGLRSDARALLRRHWQLGGAAPEPRLRLVPLLASDDAAVQRQLASADLIVAALGYAVRALPLMDACGERLGLQADRGAPLVDGHSQVLDDAGQPLDGVYALGLSAGYPLAGEYGEPSFRGQANGLSLWHGAVGAGIVQQILQRLEGGAALGRAA